MSRRTLDKIESILKIGVFIFVILTFIQVIVAVTRSDWTNALWCVLGLMVIGALEIGIRRLDHRIAKRPLSQLED